MKNFLIIILNFFCLILHSQDFDKNFENKDWRVVGIFCKKDTSYFNDFFSRGIYLNEIITFTDKIITQYRTAFTNISSYRRDGKYLEIDYWGRIWVVKIDRLTKKKLVLRDQNNTIIKLSSIDNSKMKIERARKDGG